MKNYKPKRPYITIASTIVSVKANGNQTVTVKNKYKEVDVVPDFGGTTVKSVERDFINWPPFSE